MPFMMPVQKTPSKFWDVIMGLGGMANPLAGAGEWNYLRSAARPGIAKAVAKAGVTREAKAVGRMAPGALQESVILQRLRQMAQSGRMNPAGMKDSLVNAATAGKIKPEIVDFMLGIMNRLRPGASQVAQRFADESRALGAPIGERIDVQKIVQLLSKHFGGR